jgi:serine/threonine protein kinase
VYDEDGKEFALKLFLDETDDEQDSIYTDTNSDEEISYEYDSDQDSEAEEQDFSCTTMDLGALREISILRLLRDSNGHPNIIQIHDVKLADEMSPDQEDKGRGEMSHIGITMPVFPHGTLSQAIDSNRFNTKRQKIDISHGLLSAVAFLHINGIIHRDMKGDNVMIEIQADGTYKPILIDFSLAKIIEPRALYSYKCTSPEENNFWEGIDVSIHGEDTHTPSVGTPTYRAPEVVGEKPYGLASDMYSVGAVLLELLIGKTLEVVKDRGAQRLVSEYKDKLPDQPKSSVLIMVEVRESRSTLKLMLTLKRRRVLTLFRRFGSHHYFFVHY